MDVQAIAKQLESMGMGGDNKLIHVNPNELQQIAKLLGHGPTINKKTGLLSFDDGGGGDSGDASDSSGSADGAGAGNAGGGAGDPGSDTADTGTTGDPNAGETGAANESSAANVSTVDDALSMAQQQQDLAAVNTISISPEDLTDLATVPDRSVMGQIANAIADPFGVTIGTDPFGNFQAEIDANIPGTLAGMIGGPMAGYAVSTIADVMGAQHATASFNSQTGFNAGLTQADTHNNTAVADAIGNMSSPGHSSSSGTSTASSSSGSNSANASNNANGGNTADTSGSGSGPNVDKAVATNLDTKDQANKDKANTSTSDTIARFIQGTAIKAALAPINPFSSAASGRLVPESLLKTISMVS